MRNLAFGAAVILVVVLFIGLLYAVQVQTPTSTVLTAPTATATATTTLLVSTATPAPSLTLFPSPTGPYVNSTYKFSVILPPPYRKSSRAALAPGTPQRYVEAFTARTDADEAAIDTSGCHTACPLWQYVAYVIVNPGTGSQTPREYYAKEEGATASQRIEDTLVDGRPAINVTNGAVFPMQFIIKDGDRIVVVAYQLYPPENGMAIPAGASKEKLDAILASFKFLP